MLQVRITLLLLFLTTSLYAQTDSTYSYLFRHYPYDSLTQGQVERLEEIKNENKDDLLSQRFVKLKEYLLENGAFYLNFSEDSIVFVTGEFESFGDWNYYYWTGRADIPDSMGKLSVTFRTYGWDFAFSYSWSYYPSDSHFTRGYTLRYLGDSMYFLGEYHHKVGNDFKGIMECEGPFTDLPVVLQMKEMWNSSEYLQPWKNLGKKVYFCNRKNIQVDFRVTDLAGKSIVLINKYFTESQNSAYIQDPQLSKGMYVFWLIISREGEVLYERAVKMVKVQ